MSSFIEHVDTIKSLEISLDKCYSLEHEYADEIMELKDALEKEQETRVALEEKLKSIEESHNEIISKIIKERDHVLAKNKVLKKEKVVFGVAHAKLIEEMERLDKAHKALESEHSLLLKSHEQTQLSKLVS